MGGVMPRHVMMQIRSNINASCQTSYKRGKKDPKCTARFESAAFHFTHRSPSTLPITVAAAGSHYLNIIPRD